MVSVGQVDIKVHKELLDYKDQLEFPEAVGRLEKRVSLEHLDNLAMKVAVASQVHRVVQVVLDNLDILVNLDNLANQAFRAFKVKAVLVVIKAHLDAVGEAVGRVNRDLVDN